MKYLLTFLFVIGCAGPQGATGSAGSSNGCTVLTLSLTSQTPNGGTLLSCTDGTSALIFNGSNGTPGTVIGIVQLCPTQGVPTYGNWPEVGFCINNVLYGLFQDNKGNLENTTLSSGNYNDLANNTTCHLVINGCSISN